ncbi:uncharacterized protein [Littorina saxatilis]|uniref:uncharacterized protein n=1 Tax=Littorina saxatilis TaxID=31220 RepID=UPI0038B5F633
MKELRTTFLWHETVKDVENFQKLSSDIHQRIRSKAKKKDVLLSMTDKGLRICGQKDKVREVQLLIRDKMYNLVVQQSKQGRGKRQELGLPMNTDSLPAYWKMSQKYGNITYEKAMEIWNKQGVCTTPVTPEEYAEIEKLVMATWQCDKVGHGRDARDLTHKAVKVLNIQRLENPELWRLYSQKREMLFNGLVDHHNGAGPAVCTPVENLSGSRGPVQTSENIEKTGLLNQDVYPQFQHSY